MACPTPLTVARIGRTGLVAFAYIHHRPVRVPEAFLSKVLM